MLPSLCEHYAEQMHQARLQIASHSQWTETGHSHTVAQLSTRGCQHMSGRSVLRAMCLTNPHADKVCMNHAAAKASLVQLHRLSPVSRRGFMDNVPRPRFRLHYCLYYSILQHRQQPSKHPFDEQHQQVHHDPQGRPRTRSEYARNPT